MNIDSYFEHQGSGSPIVFIHGSFASTSTWKKMIELLADNHHCISIKLPGHCGTDDPKNFYDPTLEQELAIIEQVVNKLTGEPIHLVGHSFGGVIALAQALKGNLKIAKMTLFEPVACWILRSVGDQKMNTRLQKFLTNYRKDTMNNQPYVAGQVIDFWAGAGAFSSLPDFIKGNMAPLVPNNIRHWDIDAATCTSLSDLHKCVIPTHFVCGDKSNCVARAICNHLSKQMPNCHTTVIEGASHFLVTSHAKKCTDAVLDKTKN